MSEAEARVAGERSESAILEKLPALRYVNDERAEHYDAEADDDVGPVDAGDVVEIKSAAVVLGSGSPGRFYLRRRQHQRLVDERGWYLFVVASPNDREVLAYTFLEAADVPISGWWYGGESRAEYRQFVWTDFIDESEVYQ
jgi:hypothetical protein